jgi:hypothetical protein
LQGRSQDPPGNNFKHTFHVIKAFFVTPRLSQRSAEVADLRLLCVDLGAEAAAARTEAQRQQLELG